MTVSPSGSGVVEAANFGRINVKNYPPSTTEECFNINETITLTANPASGYTFSSWRITGGTSYSGTRNPFSFDLPGSSDVSTRVTAYFTGSVTPPPSAEAETVTLNEAKAMIDSNDPVIVIDVRESANFDAGHIVCAHNYPWSSGYLSQNYADLSNFMDYDIVVYGKDRSPSDDAADFLVEKGFTSVYHMRDGMDGWEDNGWHTIDSDCDCETCSLPPMAHAGPDQTVEEADSVTLNGSGSDPTGRLSMSYLWEQIDGDQSVILSDETDDRPTFTAPYVQQGGDTLVFNLTVTNAFGQKDTDSVSIDVEWVNTAVSAAAGPDQSVMAGDTVTLNGTGSSDPDGEITAYQWELFSTSAAIDKESIVLSNPSSAITTFTAPDARGWVQFRLTVTDNSGDTDTDTVMVTVNTEGTSGLASDAGPDQVVAEGTVVTLTGSWSTSLDAVVSSYQWTKVAGPPVVLSGSDAMAPEATREINPTFTAPIVESGQAELLFQFIIKDSNGATDVDTVAVTVNSQAYISENMPPVANAGPDQNVIPGTIASLDASGSSDPDDNLFSYEWAVTSGPESVILSDSAVIRPTFLVPGQSGAAVFQLIVTDDAGETDQDSVQVSWVNEPPVADAGPDQAVFEKETVGLYGAGSSDPDDGISTYQWNKISGPAVTLSDSSVANPTFVAPTTDLEPVVVTFKLIITDGSGQISTDEVSITVNNKNDIPITNAGADQQVNEASVVQLDGSGSFDPDGDAIVYQWHQVSGPVASISDDAVSSPLLYIPSIGVSQATIIMELTVADTEGQESSDRIEITVDDVGKAPVTDAGDDISAFENQTVTLDGSGSRDSDSDGEVSYLWTQTTGPTVILSDVSAESPTFTVPVVNTDSKVITFRLMVEDSDGLITFDEVAVTVEPSTEPPVPDAGPDQTVVEKDMVILDASASSDPDDGIASYQWAQASGPSVVLSDTSTVKPAFEAPEIDEPSVILSFRLTVTDLSGLERVDFVQITVTRKKSGGGSSGGCFISSLSD